MRQEAINELAKAFREAEQEALATKTFRAEAGNTTSVISFTCGSCGEDVAFPLPHYCKHDHDLAEEP